MTIEQEEFDLQQAKEELKNIDYMFPYADPEHKEMARKAAQRKVDVLQLRVNRKKNIAETKRLQDEAMYEETKAKEAEEFASKPWLERAGDMATNYFLRRTGGGALKIPGYVAQGVGFTSRALYGDNQTGRDIQQFGRYLNNEVDDFIDSGTGVRSEWFNDEQTAPESVLDRFAGSTYNTVNSLADLESAMGAIGRVGGALGGGSLMSKIPAKLRPAVEGLGFAAMNIPEHSDYIEQKSGKFKPGLATISGTLNGILMSYAFALGRGGLNMTEAQAMNFARESVRKGTFDLTKDALKQALKTAAANGSLTGLGGGAFKNLSTLNMDDDPQKYWNDLKNAALDTLKEGGREAVMGGVFGFKGAFDKAISNRQTYSNMRERGKVLLGEKPAEARTFGKTLKQVIKGNFKGVKETFSKIWSPEINDKAFDTGVNEYFFGKEGAKLRGNPEEAEKLFAGPKQNIDAFVEKVRENLPQDSVSLKDPGAVESALKAYKASLYIERNNTLLDRLAKDRGIDLNTVKEAYDKGNLKIKENGDVVGYLVGKIEDIKLELKNTNDTINKLDVTIKSKDVDLQTKQEAAQQKEETLLRQEELYRKAETPYTRAEVIEAVRDMVARGYGNNPEMLNKATERLADFLSRYNSQEPIGVDDAIRLLNEVESELNKLNPNVKFDNYNSDIEDIISPKLIGSDVIYGRDERNIPTSVIPTDYTEPRQIGYDGIIYGRDERNMPTSALPNNTQPQSVLPSPQETPLLEYNPTGRRQMPISEGSNQPINNMDVGSKVNRESPSSFGVVNDIPRSVNMSEKPTGSIGSRPKTSNVVGKKIEMPTNRLKKSEKAEALQTNGVAVKKGEFKDRDIPMSLSKSSSEPMAVKKESVPKAEIKTSAADKLDVSTRRQFEYIKTFDDPNEFRKPEQGEALLKTIKMFEDTVKGMGDKLSKEERDELKAEINKIKIPTQKRLKELNEAEAKTEVKQAKPKAELESPKPNVSEKATGSADNIKPIRQNKIDSIDKVGNKAVRDSESFDTRADMPQSVMTDRSESPAIKNERGKMGLDVEMKQKEVKNNVKTEKDTKYSKLANLLQKAGYKKGDEISKKELNKLARKAGFNGVENILAEVNETPFVDIGEIPLNNLKNKDGSSKMNETKYRIRDFSGLSEEGIKNRNTEYTNQQKAKEYAEEQTRLREKYPILNNIDTNEKLWKALDNVNSKELQDILLAENGRRFEEAQKTPESKAKWDKEFREYRLAKSETKPSTEKPIETSSIDEENRKSFGLSDKTPVFKASEKIGIEGKPKELRVSKDGRVVTDNKMLIVMNEGETVPKSGDKEIEGNWEGNWESFFKYGKNQNIPIPYFKAKKLPGHLATDIDLVAYENGSVYLVNNETGTVMQLAGEKGIPLKNGKPVEGAKLNGKAIENINKILGGDLRITSISSHNYPVTFEGKKGKAVLMPRINDSGENLVHEYAIKKGLFDKFDTTGLNKEYFDEISAKNKHYLKNIEADKTAKAEKREIEKARTRNELNNEGVKFFLNNGEADDSDSISDLRRQESEAYHKNTDLVDIPIGKFKANKGSEIPVSRSQSGMIESTASEMYIYPNGTVVVVTPKEKGGTAEFINGTRIPLVDGSPDRAFVVNAKAVEEASKILGGNIKIKGVAPSEGVVIFSGDNGKMTIQMKRLLGRDDSSYGNIKRNNIILESAAKKGLIDIADVNPGKMNEFLNQRARKLSNSIKEFKDKQNAKEAERQAKAKAEQEKAKAELEAENNSYGGFLDGKKPFQQGAVKKALDKKLYWQEKSKSLTTKEVIDELAETGKLVAKEYNDNGKKTYAVGFREKIDGSDVYSSWKVGKTAYEYAKFKESKIGKNEIKQSRTKDKATNPVTDKELNNFLRGQAKQISKETGLNFKVVDSVNELRKMFPNNDITDTVEGGIHNDTVYLVRGNIDKDRLPLVIAHEVAGHRGVESLFENKQQMDNFFNSLERAAAKDKFIRDAFAEVDRLGYKENRSREAMAKIVEKVRNESGTLKGTAKTFVNFITSRVRRLLRRMGFKNLQLNEAEVYDIAVQALRRTGLKNSNKFFGLDRFLAKDNSFLSAKDDSLKSLGMSERNGKASWSNDRINYLIDEYGSKSDNRYSQAYATTIDPVDFLKLTLGEKNYQKLWKQFPEDFEVKDLNSEKLKGERQTPFLIVEGNAKDPTRIVGHEGRHRLLALAKAGIKSVPVVVIDKDTKYNKEVMPPTELKNQKGQNNSILSFKAFTQEQMIPIKESNRETLRKMFGGEADIQFSIGGERAKTANIAKLEEAKKRLKDGDKKLTDIWQKTGWYIAKDGKPRFEISDRRFGFRKKALEVINDFGKDPLIMTKRFSLKNLIHHKKLFDAYPQLKNLPVYFDLNPNTKETAYGHFHPKKEDIGFIVLHIKNTGKGEKLKETLLHETQHAIQRIEGFSSGATPEYARNFVVNQLYNKKEKAINSLSSDELKKLAIDYDLKLRDSQEIEADLEKNKDNEELIRESYKAIKDLRKAKDSLLEALTGKKLNPSSDNYEQDRFSLMKGNEDLLDSIDKYNRMAYGPEKNRKSDYSFYERVYGEQEANAVTKRMYNKDSVNKRYRPESEMLYENALFDGRGHIDPIFIEQPHSSSSSRDHAVISETEKKILDEIGEVKNPRDYNAVKKIAKNRMAEYKDVFSTKKNTGYTTAALKLHYLLGFDRKTQSVEKAFQSIRDFSTLQKTAGAYARSIIGDKSTQANILDSIVKAKTFEKVYDIISKTNIAKEKEIRKNLLDDFRNTIKELNPKKISTPTRMYTDEILGESFTPEELDSLIHSNEFTTKAVGKLRNIADNLASELGKIRESDIEVSEYAINNAARLKHELNEIIKQRDAGNGAMNVPVEKLAEVNQLLKRFVNQDKLYKESLDTSAKNAAVADREQILSESPEKNPKTVNSRETNSIGRFKEYFLPGKALKTQDNENVTATMGKTMHKVAYEDLLEGQNRQDHYRATGYKGVDRIMESFGKDLEDGREYLDKTAFKVKTSEGHEYEITNNEALAIIANYLDRETGQIIKKAGKVNFYLGEKKDSDYFTFTRKELDDMVNKLTPKQKKAIEDGFALLSNDFLPELNRVYEKLNGVPLRLIQGRYFPRIHVDITQSGSNGLITRDKAPYIHQQMNADYQGILKQRDAMATPNLNLRGFTDTLQNYTDQASLYIGMAEPLRHLNRVMNGQMKRELTARYGAEYVNRINQMTRLMAGMAGKTEVDKGFATRYLSNLAAAKLTPLSAIKQLTSVPLASSVIPAEFLAKAAISGMSNENIKEMMELDGMVLRYRSNGIAGIIPVNAKTWGRERIQGEKFKGQKLIDKAVGVGLNLSLMADKRALGIIYKATKLWAESQGKGSDKAWIENKFMEAVRRTQNTTDLASATGWQMDSRESGTMAFLNMYLNQTQKVSNEFFRNKRLMDEAAKKYGKDSAQYKEARNRTATFAASAALMEAMMLAIGSGASMLFKGKDEDSAKDKAITAVSDLTGNPLLKPMLNAYSLQGVLKGKKPTNAAVFGDDFSGMIPEITYTLGRVMNDLQSDDPAARKFRKLSYDMLSSKAAETSLALGRVPTWFARYPAKFIKRVWGEDLKNTRQKSLTPSSSGSSRLFSGKRTFGNSRTFGGKRIF